jgi:peptidoglycan/LPS O-acetylase OafA/YrhL
MQRHSARDNNFDLIRLVAAFQVVLVHAEEHLHVGIPRPVIEILGRFPGVPIFFVISGFLISASYVRSTSLVAYAKNRLLRIYPGLWVCFLVSVATVVVFHGLHAPASRIVAWALAQLSIGQVYNPDFLRGYGVGALNGSLWSIPVELQFYVVLPLIYLLFAKLRWNRGALAVLTLGLVAVHLGYARLREIDTNLLVKVARSTVVPWLYLFFVGIFLQRASKFVDRYMRGKALYWLVVYACASAALAAAGANVTGNLIHPVAAVLLAGLTISAAFTPVAGSHVWLHGNDISYGVYIYHMIVINALVASGLVGRGVDLIWTLGATVAVSLASWVLVEKPAMRLKSYSLRRDTQERPQPG